MNATCERNGRTSKLERQQERKPGPKRERDKRLHSMRRSNTLRTKMGWTVLMARMATRMGMHSQMAFIVRMLCWNQVRKSRCRRLRHRDFLKLHTPFLPLFFLLSLDGN